MKPHQHARISVHHWGGVVEDYLPIHDFIDGSKAHLADVRHRAMLHNTWGIYLAERVFGTTITTSKGRIVSVRDVAEQHVLDDLGRIPTVADWLREMPIAEWMGGPVRRTRRVPMDEIARAGTDNADNVDNAHNAD